MINIGKYIEIAINWLTEHFARFFDVINDGVGGFIDAFQDGLTWIPSVSYTHLTLPTNSLV